MPLRFLWDFINRPLTGVLLLLLSAVVFPFSSLALRIITGLWLIYLTVRIAEETACWVQTRHLSPRELLEKREDFRSVIVSLTPEEAAARIPSAFASPLWRARVYRERTRFYFEVFGLIPVQFLKLLFYSGALAVVAGFLFAPITDKAVQFPLVPGDTLMFVDSGVSFRLEGIYPEELGGQGAFLQDGKLVKSGELTSGKPLWVGLFWAIPVGKGPALKVKIKGEKSFLIYPGGKEFSGEATVPFFMPNDEKYAFLPNRRVILRLILMPGSGAQFLVEVYREGAERADFKTEITRPEALEVAGVAVEIAPAASLIVKITRVFSLWLITLGLTLIAGAFMLWFLFPVGKIFGFIQKEEKVKINWVQEDPLKSPSFAWKVEEWCQSSGH